jgi:large subunit ribosomal protein L1
VTFDVSKAVAEMKAGRVDFRVDKVGIVHCSIGKVSFGKEKIMDNVRALLEMIMKLKPSSSKGTYLRSFTVSSTMGPGVRIAPDEVPQLLK